MKPMLVILVGIVLLAARTVAHAQNWRPESGYTIITPGEPTTFVNPNFNGGYTAITPGEPPTFINPSFNGGYTLITPGEPPTFINPTLPSPPRMPMSGENDDGDY